MSYRCPHRVAHVVVPPAPGGETAVYLLRLPDGDPYKLLGTAALIWVIASEGDPDVPTALAELVGEPRAAIADDVHRYLDELVQQGWLERVPEGGAR